jgi:hypothetical protein
VKVRVGVAVGTGVRVRVGVGLMVKVAVGIGDPGVGVGGGVGVFTGVLEGVKVGTTTDFEVGEGVGVTAWALREPANPRAIAQNKIK